MNVYVLTKQIIVDFDVPGNEELPDAATLIDYVDYEQTCRPRDVFTSLEAAQAEGQRLYAQALQNEGEGRVAHPLIWKEQGVGMIWVGEPPVTGRTDYFDERYYVHLSSVLDH